MDFRFLEYYIYIILEFKVIDFKKIEFYFLGL